MLFIRQLLLENVRNIFVYEKINSVYYMFFLFFQKYLKGMKKYGFAPKTQK